MSAVSGDGVRDLVQRLLSSLRQFVGDSEDPGAEALGAIWEAESFLAAVSPAAPTAAGNHEPDGHWTLTLSRKSETVQVYDFQGRPTLFVSDGKGEQAAVCITEDECEEVARELLRRTAPAAGGSPAPESIEAVKRRLLAELQKLTIGGVCAAVTGDWTDFEDAIDRALLSAPGTRSAHNSEEE